jgi:hypothetical protein
MRKSLLPIGGALLALAAFAPTADARMMGGGGGMSISSSMSHSAPMSSSMGSSHTFSPDGRTFSASGRSFSPDGLQIRVKGSNWKKPIDSDGGGPADPQPKPPKGSTQTSSDGGGQNNPYDPYGFHNHGHPGYVDAYGHYHPGSDAGGGGNVPQRDCRGC